MWLNECGWISGGWAVPISGSNGITCSGWVYVHCPELVMGFYTSTYYSIPIPSCGCPSVCPYVWVSFYKDNITVHLLRPISNWLVNSRAKYALYWMKSKDHFYHLNNVEHGAKILAITLIFLCNFAILTLFEVLKMVVSLTSSTSQDYQYMTKSKCHVIFGHVQKLH